MGTRVVARKCMEGWLGGARKKTKGVTAREGGMSCEGVVGGRGICVPEMDALRLARKWKKVPSGDVGNSPGKTSEKLKTALMGEELDSSRGEEQKAKRLEGRWPKPVR